MDYIAKASSLSAIKDKKEKGATAIEWQLIGDNYEPIKGELPLPIINVHTTLVNNNDVCFDLAFAEHNNILINPNFELKSKPIYHYKELLVAMNLAEYYAIHQGIQVVVVVHSMSCIPVSKYQEIAQWFLELFKAYPHVDIAVENSSVIGNERYFRGVSEPSSIPFYIESIRKFLPFGYKNRLGTTLDTCHALMSARLMNLIAKEEELDSFVVDETSFLEQHFISYSDTIKVIHFNNARNLGKRKNHGVGFYTEADKVLCKNLFDFYKKYAKGARFVIEIREDDYENAINFENTVKLLNTFIQNTGGEGRRYGNKYSNED